MRQTSNNPWDLLGIKPGSTPEQIKRAFKKRALEVHPDRKNGNEEHFKLINDAYNKLKNNNLVPVLTSTQTKLVNLDLSMRQQIYGVNDIVEISNGESVKVKIPPGAVADDKIKVTEQQLNQLQKLVDEGVRALADLSEVKAQLATDQQTYVNAENSIDLALLSLAQLLQISNVEFNIQNVDLELSY